MIRSFPLVLCLALLVAGCALWSDGDEQERPAEEECAEEAQRVSGFRVMPKRSRTRIQRRDQDQKWEVYQQVYASCMEERKGQAGQ